MMAYRTDTLFPGIVDDKVFISDVSLSSKDIMEQHMEYISNGQYSNAAEYIKEQQDQRGITPITADLFHMLSNRIFALQHYLTSDECDKCHRYYGTEPSADNVTNGTIWIE